MQLSFKFVDKSFRPANAAIYRLSIQISLNGFSFCVFDTVKNKHVVLKHYIYTKNILQDWCDEIAEILADIRDIDSKTPAVCLYVTRKNVIIPPEILDEKTIKQHLSFWFDIEEEEEIHTRRIQEIDASICYLIPSWLITKLHTRFSNLKFLNQTCHHIRQICNDPNDTKMKLVFCGNFIDLTVFKDNALMFNNTFTYSSIVDAAYFLVAVAKKIDTLQAPLHVSGDVSIAEIDELNRCFPNMQQNHDKKMTLRLGKETSSRFYNILLLNECE
ncbi:MAG: DUF3822 family protein [Prevotellaceae bacterium]|jgi:hypothetical protein|nr:DUF3822 family protein [Prevotellaceae bacterium]